MTNQLKAARKYRYKLKLAALTHYGKNGTMTCCWPGCEISDPDMLTLDHIENDGALKRRNGERGGWVLAMDLAKKGWPSGFQTLCGNHQWKKELLRRRSE